ncbi:MAG: hypothetical protein LBT58_04205 [Endomicrobium sp.]|jgi:hypothetical protein|nr:hypothetical protein [Endomicrobium sp.]
MDIFNVEEFLASKLTREQKKIREILKTFSFSNDAESIYIAGICILKIDNFPAQQSIVSHCFRELINAILRWEETECKDQAIVAITDALKKVGFIKNGRPTDERIKETVNQIWDKIKSLHNERDKMKKLISERHPKLKTEEIDNIVNKTNEAKKKINGLRHFDKEFKTILLDEFNEHIKTLENFILYLEPYLEQKEVSYDILESSKKRNVPTKDEIEHVANLKSNLKPYFFSKLENPEWFKPLNERELLFHSIDTNENGQEIFYWDSLPYLIKITADKYDDILELIRPIVEDMDKGNKINSSLVCVCVFDIAMNMPDDKFIFICKSFFKWLRNSNDIYCFYEEKLKKFFEKLKSIDKNLTLDIIKELLKLSVNIKKESPGIFDNNGNPIEFDDSEVVSKFGSHESYGYEQFVEIIKSIFKYDDFELFKLFRGIYNGLFAGISNEEIERYEDLINHRRSAIEYNRQDGYSQDESVYIIVSAIRDYAEAILKNNDKSEIKDVFNLLKDGKFNIFTRIILHLLRVSDNYEKALLAEYMTDKNLFDNPSYHHEYYLLEQEKFRSLPIESQNMIFGYIDKGPIDENYQKDDGEWTSEKKKNRWRIHKLEPIRKYLPEQLQTKYKDILTKDGEPIYYNGVDGHPEFLSYKFSSDSLSPLPENAMSNMSIEEIINYLKPDNKTIDSSDIHGLSNSLLADVKAAPKKYLENLASFNEISEPAYIYSLLFGLREYNKTQIDWDAIVDFGNRVLEQNSSEADFFEHSNWHWAKQAVAELVADFFRQAADKNIDDIFLKNSFKILKSLLLEKDKYLEKERNDESIDYYNSAINSTFGTAFEGLIRYGLWQHNSEKSNDNLKSCLEKLLSDSAYLETWALFGRWLPRIRLMFSKWTTENIDKILPKNEPKKFKAAWTAYINFVNPSNDIDMFDLMKPKFEYVLQNNKLFLGNKENNKLRISQHIAIYYASEKIDLNDDIMEYVFNRYENSQERRSFINFIGVSLKNSDDVPKKIIDRYQKFWDWRVCKIESNESRYVKELEQFEWWYRCRKFDRKWAIEQMHNLVVNHNINMRRYMIEETLLEDLPTYTRQTFDIVKKLSIGTMEMHDYSKNNIIEETVKYIKENKFDDEALKTDKDTFINEFLEKRAYDAQEWTEKLQPYLE